MSSDRVVDGRRQTVVHQLRTHAKIPEGRRPHLVGGPLIDTDLGLEDPPFAPAGGSFDPPDALAGPQILGAPMPGLPTARRQVGVLGRRDAIACSNVVQHEVAVRVDHLTPLEKKWRT
jgi:hypothetical protein